jgi:hypothetical protein
VTRNEAKRSGKIRGTKRHQHVTPSKCAHFRWKSPEWHSGGQGFEPPRLHHLPERCLASLIPRLSFSRGLTLVLGVAQLDSVSCCHGFLPLLHFSAARTDSNRHGKIFFGHAWVSPLPRKVRTQMRTEDAPHRVLRNHPPAPPRYSDTTRARQFGSKMRRQLGENAKTATTSVPDKVRWEFGP